MLNVETLHLNQYVLNQVTMNPVSCTSKLAYDPEQGPGVCIDGEPEAIKHQVLKYANQFGLAQSVECFYRPGRLKFQLRPDLALAWMPGHDTLQLARLPSRHADGQCIGLEQEIFLAMLGAPGTFAYPNFAEFLAAIRIRRNICDAARKTQLAFHTTDLERPKNYWGYHEDTGFTILPGRKLADALMMATQPEESAHLYAFSCYRASEYVMLLGIAQELEQTNPALLKSLEERCQRKAIKSAEFHDTFLNEYGSMQRPLPGNYYVPGDRLWFRNPDAQSSDASGYEGSWLIYLGGGEFSNFWDRNNPYTFESKCVEMFHWRHAVFADQSGDLRIDEKKVKDLTQQSMSTLEGIAQIVQKMSRVRDQPGVYDQGGMLDASRECVRWVCPGTSTIQFASEPAVLRVA